jgi:teichuronic acid biosynthesis glycosyltransferase TuaH
MFTRKHSYKYFVLINFNLPWNWSTDYTNQTAFFLGKNNVVVCYMLGDVFSIKEYLTQRKFPTPIKKYSKNITLFYPILYIPFRRFKKIYEINMKINMFLLKVYIRFINARSKTREKIVWNFDPQFGYLTNYFNNDWIKIYDCVDFFAGSVDVGFARNRIYKQEKLLVENSDFVFANSTVLKKYLEKYKKDIFLVPQGFRTQNFEFSNNNAPNLKKSGRPLIGFVGAVNHRIDYDLLTHLAQRHREWYFAIWGKLLEKEMFTKHQMKMLTRLKNLPNVIFGQSDKQEIPSIIKQFDIGMIPYDQNSDFNKYCYPMKLFEYFYMGKPVISTQIKELERFPNLVKIGKDYASWEKKIKIILKNGWSQKNKNKQKELAIENSWENKIEKILLFIKQGCTKKA